MRGRVSAYAVAGALAGLVCAGGNAVFGQQSPQPAPSAQHPGSPEYTQADILRGSRLFAANCVSCHGASGDSVDSARLSAGQFRRGGTDQELESVIVNGIPGTGMPAHKFAPSELVGIVAYLRNMRSGDGRPGATGDADRGKALFEGKGRCATCHRVKGNGSRVAPDLSDIGAIRAAGTLQASLLDPTGGMMPINRPVRAVTRDGRVINGRRLNEDTYTVQLVDDQERLVSLVKADLREYAILSKSAMPSYKDTLSSTELADVVAYLLTLKGS